MTLRTRDIPWGYKDIPLGSDPYGGDETACIVCGQATAREYWLHVIDGGGTALHPGDEDKYTDDGGDLYFHPIGSGCRRRHGFVGWTHSNLEVKR